MTFGERIIALRIEKGYATRKSFAEKLGVPETTLRNYEKNEREPGHSFLIELSNVFDVSTDYLLGITDEKEKIRPYELKSSEYEHVKTYRALDVLGKEHIDYELNKELERVEQLQAQQERINALEVAQQKLSEQLQSMRIYTYFGEIACAGPGFYFDEIPTETMEAPDMGGDFIIGVNGDSMEPDYHNGDKLYVKKTEYISHGDVGIFTIGNECFLKEYGEGGLISRNKEYNDIPGTEDVRLIGKVIGKVPEDI
ncbi:MAG: helix-turn-helix domain-containing protein [Lachnospiraceae bacterium]|nr:helix-turn-helix domain-containing protein [Lachnospiraceae bacterium]MCI9470762.1 helix-turn-helix domain-containing protein [Lachnospiraceae bacterium]